MSLREKNSPGIPLIELGSSCNEPSVEADHRQVNALVVKTNGLSPSVKTGMPSKSKSLQIKATACLESI